MLDSLPVFFSGLSASSRKLSELDFSAERREFSAQCGTFAKT
jgi:hypothetical protein